MTQSRSTLHLEVTMLLLPNTAPVSVDWCGNGLRAPKNAVANNASVMLKLSETHSNDIRRWDGSSELIGATIHPDNWGQERFLEQMSHK